MPLNLARTLLERFTATMKPTISRHLARPAARFSKTPATIRHGGRALGADTEAVLREIGYTPEEIARLT